MRSLADVLRGFGWRVTGSDNDPHAVLDLRRRGLQVSTGHAADHLRPTTDLVIYSDAVASHNPERRRAAALGIPALSYAQALGRIMQGSCGLAVAGTHGKSSTTLMAARILIDAGLAPTVVAGATPLTARSGGRAGRGDFTLVEACEYRRNFLHLRPQSAAILNVEPDHFDCYSSFAEVEDAFARFAASLPPHGLLVFRQDCAVTGRVARQAGCPAETFGFGRGADWRAKNLRSCRGRYRFCLVRRGRAMAQITLRVPGRHNVLNALAAGALSFAAGADGRSIERGLNRFGGVRRRLELVGKRSGIVFLDDYAHHPTEITAALASVRQMFPKRRLWCVFQPHQVSRTASLLDEFAASLQNADKIIVAEIFRARERQAAGEVTAADLVDRVRLLGGDVEGMHSPAEIVDQLVQRLAPDDVLITMGAGNIRNVCDGLAEGLRFCAAS
jgi:UDP-N-acetylmuramate--alanine ligase